jgi:hypothetical protein
MSNIRRTEKITFVSLSADQVKHLKSVGFEIGNQLPELFFVKKSVATGSGAAESKFLELDEIHTALKGSD